MLICHDQRSGSGCGTENPDGAVQCQHCGLSLRFALHLHNTGTLVRDYQIRRVIGFGGFGAVYEAEATRTPGVRVAIKESFDPAGMTSFQGEFAALQQHQHPHLPRYEAMFVEQGSGYLVMELIPGQNLDEVQNAEHGALPETQVLGFALQLCEVLSYLHRQTPPIIHRDIKPANIRLTPNGRIKLVDFGLFKQGNDSTKSSRMGLTPAYAPLEQHPLAPGHTDQRSDIYSLGATLFHLLTGQMPMPAFERIKYPVDPFVSPRYLNPLLSPHVATAITQAMSLKPEDRYPDIAAFQQALVGQRPQPLAPQSLPPTVLVPTDQRPLAPKTIFLGVGAGLLMLFLIIGFGWVSLAGRSGVAVVAPTAATRRATDTPLPATPKATTAASATLPVQASVVVAATAAPLSTITPARAEGLAPHPILSNSKVRQAIAYCTDRPQLIASVYPYLSAEQQQRLLMDTFLPKTHWAAATTGITTYPFDVTKGQALLDAAGWKLGQNQIVRANAAGDPLSLRFTTTDAQFRQTWSAVFIQQMAACGIQIIPNYAPSSWWFGSNTGLRRRDFELGALAWIGEPDPKGQTLYACNSIPLPTNDWQGQNYMGWCNPTASEAIIAANNTLDRAERMRQYAIVQQEFTKDMVSLPLFNRSEVAAVSNRVKGFKPNPTEYYTANITDWSLTDGGDTVVLGMSQEPASFWANIETSSAQAIPAFLVSTIPATKYDYDYQPVDLKQLPTLANGGALNTEVEVRAGDKVWSAEGEAVTLAPGVKITNAAGETITYTGGTVKLKQLAVTFEYNAGIKWEDGTPLTQADFKLGLKIDCDRESGAANYAVCDSRAKVDFLSDTSYTITYLPGVQWPEYFVYTINAYPAHQGLSNGRKLAQVPAKEWQNLPELAQDPLSTGPYVLDSWVKGQSMTFSANPNYYKGAPKIKKVVIKFITDTNQAVAQLLTGEIDVLGTETLGGGAEVQMVLDAAARGKVQAFTLASPAWEHIDFNLNVK